MVILATVSDLIKRMMFRRDVPAFVLDQSKTNYKLLPAVVKNLEESREVWKTSHKKNGAILALVPTMEMMLSWLQGIG